MCLTTDGRDTCAARRAAGQPACKHVCSARKAVEKRSVLPQQVDKSGQLMLILPAPAGELALGF